MRTKLSGRQINMAKPPDGDFVPKFARKFLNARVLHRAARLIAIQIGKTEASPGAKA